MLFELAGAILGAALQDVQEDNNHARQMESYNRQREIEQMRIQQQMADNKAARQHETTMAILSCVNAFLQAAGTGNDANGNNIQR